MRKIFWSLLVIVFCFFVGFVGCDNGGDGDDSPDHEEALNSTVITVASGDGSIFRADGYLLFDISHSGDSRFRFDLVNRNTMQTVAFLTSGYGNFEGTVEDEVPEGEYFITCNTSGSWNVDVYGDIQGYWSGGTDIGDDVIGGGTDSGNDGGGTDSGNDGGGTDSGDDTPTDCPSSITCEEISSCEEACRYLNECGLEGLDRDNDNIPCENEHCDDPC